MGAVFRAEHANLIAYLTSRIPPTAPFVMRSTVREFLLFLRDGIQNRQHLISSGGDWDNAVSALAGRLFDRLGDDQSSADLLQPDQIHEVIDPLRGLFACFDLYALVLPGREEYDVGDGNQVFYKLAVETRDRGLVLIPEKGEDYVDVVSPFAPLRALAENPLAPPVVAFWTPEGNACVERIGRESVDTFSEILIALHAGPDHLNELIRKRSKKNGISRILHMSDLHFGKTEARNRRGYLKAQLETVLDGIDRVVITGDLFDEPKEDYRDEFDDFRNDVERMTKNELIVVPGNHDVRTKGNKLAGLGEEFAQLADLNWAPVYIDHEMRTVFFCFNSAEDGDFARGMVKNRQRRNVATKYLRLTKEHPEIVSYFKVALVHHHPYQYQPSEEAREEPWYQKIISIFWSDEDKFSAFEDADEFLNWCASRGVSLILHGHKHRPRRKLDKNGILVVGCGSTTGAENTPMSYNVVSLDVDTGRWNPLFYFDPNCDGSGFQLQSVRIDNR